MTGISEMFTAVGGAEPTMTSIDIAEICEKRHDNVLRDIKAMLDALGMPALSFEGSYTGGNGKELPCYRLPRDLTLTLVTGYSIPLRKRVIDRLDALEKRGAVTPTFLSDPATLRNLLLENVDKVVALQGQVEEMRPSVEALEQIAGIHGSMNRTEAAKHLGVAPVALIRWMRANGWTYRRTGSRDDIAYQTKIAAGYIEHKVTSGFRPDGMQWVSTQVRVTAKGLAALAKLITTDHAARQ